MIYVTGDTHMSIDIHKLSVANFPEQKFLSKSDYVIICGDYGGIWNNSAEELYWRDWMNDKPFTTLFVDGNHENFDLLNQYPVEIWNGGNIHCIADSIYHLMRGQIFTIDGLKFFTMGGAASHDKEYRREGISWWPQELPSDAEYEEAIHKLDEHEWNVDYIISHCAPDGVLNNISDWFEHDKCTNFLEVVKQKCQYKHWYFGHYHIDRDIDAQHTCMYNHIIPLN
ncbi:MAG TPA: metallophosphoesterase [Saprospiraceae bacterium]|nr:metallophosphoesterase [Saprospiraceae bacterium]